MQSANASKIRYCLGHFNSIFYLLLRFVFAFCNISLLWGGGQALRPQDLADYLDICSYFFCPNNKDAFATCESKVGIHHPTKYISDWAICIVVYRRQICWQRRARQVLQGACALLFPFLSQHSADRRTYAFVILICGRSRKLRLWPQMVPSYKISRRVFWKNESDDVLKCLFSITR